jgi:hypothetical protein
VVNLCGQGVAWLATATKPTAAAGIICSGTFAAGGTERFESGAGAFCLSDITKTDAGSRLDSYYSGGVTGSRSMRVNATTAGQAIAIGPKTATTAYVQFYIKVNSFSSGAGDLEKIFGACNSDGFAVTGNFIEVRRNGDSTISLRLNGVEIAPISLSTWYRVTVLSRELGQGDSTATVYAIGGSSQGTTTQASADRPQTHWAIGSVDSGATIDVQFDNFSISTTDYPAADE